MISKEQFEEWLSSPVTQEVREFARYIADEKRQTWLAALWNSDDLSELTPEHLKAKAQYEAYEDLAELDWEAIQEWQSDE